MSVILPGLSADESESYISALEGPCLVHMQVLQLTLNHVLVNTVDPHWIDGQINVVEGDQAGITRTLQMGFYDPEHALRLDSSVPAAGMGGLDRLIRVNPQVYCPDIDRWLSTPAFTGRPSVLTRDGDTVTVEAQGKECLHLNKPAPYQIAKGSKVVNVIKSILIRNGETHFRFPTNYRDTVPAVVNVGGSNDDRRPWIVAFKLAQTIGLQLYYDTAGYACLRKLPTTPSWTLRETGEDANMLARPKLNTDLGSIRNRAVVTGKTVARGKVKSKPLTSNNEYGQPERSHPFHPDNLALVAGKPWINAEYYSKPELHTQAKVNAFARARINELVRENIGFEAKVVPWWHSVARDLIAVKARGGDFNVRVLNSSMPLGPTEDGGTVGFNQRVRKATAGSLRR